MLSQYYPIWSIIIGRLIDLLLYFSLGRCKFQKPIHYLLRQKLMHDGTNLKNTCYSKPRFCFKYPRTDISPRFDLPMVEQLNILR